MTLVYADASALVKLLLREPESDAVAAALAEADRVVSSAIALLELTCVARRQALQSAEARVAAIGDRLATLPVDEAVLTAARTHAPQPALRALDAIHLASARRLATIEANTSLVAYDRDLLAAASHAGLRTSSPTARHQTGGGS